MMTFKELKEIEERWKFGTNTRDDVRKLLDEVGRFCYLGDELKEIIRVLYGDPSVPKPQGIIEHQTKG